VNCDIIPIMVEYLELKEKPEQRIGRKGLEKGKKLREILHRKK